MILASLICVVSVLDAKAGTVVIRKATIFDSKMGVMLPNRTIVIVGGRIQAIGSPQRRVKSPAGARVLEARGKYIIPGLIDAHVHLAMVWDEAHITGDQILPFFLANGVTSLRDVGDDIIAEKLIARYAEAHPGSSPRIFLSSPLIDGSPPWHPNLGSSWAGTDPAQVPKFVQDMADWGATTLKIYVGTDRSIGQKVIEEGHRHGLVVTGHLGKYSAQDAVADGIDCLEHIWSVFDYLLPDDAPRWPVGEEERKMKPSDRQNLALTILESRAGVDLDSPKARELVSAISNHRVWVDPTLVVFRNMLLLPDLPEVLQNPDNAFMPERLRKFWPTWNVPSVRPETQDLRMLEFKKYQDLTGLLFRAGVPLLVGTDEPCPYVPPGFSLHQELEFLVESGLTPAAVLQAATMNNAQALKQDRQLGSIEEGKLADLVILEANPLADIKNTRKIYRVIRGGVISDPSVLLSAVRSE